MDYDRNAEDYREEANPIGDFDGYVFATEIDPIPPVLEDCWREDANASHVFMTEQEIERRDNIARNYERTLIPMWAI